MTTTITSTRRRRLAWVGILVIALALAAGATGCELIPGAEQLLGLLNPDLRLTITSTMGGSVTTPGEGSFSHKAGAVIDLVAESDADYRFVGWTATAGLLEGTTAATTTFTMPAQAATIIANFAPLADYRLTMATDPEEAGTVIDVTDESPYAEGAIVGVKAEARPGYIFSHWTASAGVFDDPFSAETALTMPAADVTVIAHFVEGYQLTVDSTDGGLVTAPGEGTFTYTKGAVVELVATAWTCYEFTHWSGDSVADHGSRVTAITMDAARNVTASFTPFRYELTVETSGGGSVTAPGEGTFTYDCGTAVALKALPDPGYSFLSWTGDVATVNNRRASSTNIVMQGEYSIVATFIQESEPPPPPPPPTTTYSLTMAADPEQGGTATDVTCLSPYTAGTVVGLKAEPAEGYVFAGWAATAGVVGDVAASETTFTMPDQNVTISACFEIKAGWYELTILSTDGGATTPAEGTYVRESGTAIDLTATAAEGYVFGNWTATAGVVGNITAAETIFTMPGGVVTITASFVLETFATTGHIDCSHIMHSGKDETDIG